MLDPVQIVVVVLASLAAGILAAVAGFGGAAIMTPVLVWVFGVRDAVPLLTVAQLIGNGLGTFRSPTAVWRTYPVRRHI